MSTITIRALTKRDLDDVTVVHLDAFAKGSLTSLGSGAVRRYYEWLLDGPHDSIAVGAFDDEQLVGFCFGGVFRGAMSGFLQRNRGYLAGRVLLRPWLIANPLVRDRAVAAGRILLRTYKSPPAPAPATPTGFGILAIAVASRARGGGAAHMLMSHAELIAGERAFSRMQLTVATNNARAIAFYVREGWHKEPPDPDWRGLMIKPLR